MRIAIYVYQTTSITITTNESGVHLYGMTAASVALSQGASTHTVVPGIYKILSSQEVQVAGDSCAFESVTSNTKENDPTPPPGRAITSFASLDIAALNTFMSTLDAKVMVNP